MSRSERSAARPPRSLSPPVYDNRASLDEWNLQRMVREACDEGDMASLVRRYGELLCDIAAGLTERDLDVSLPVLIISKDEVLVDEARPLRSLLAGLSGIHLAGHADQLRGLRTMTGGG